MIQCAIARASRSNRSLKRAEEILTATLRPSRVSTARKTSPIPPRAQNSFDSVRPQLRTHPDAHPGFYVQGSEEERRNLAPQIFIAETGLRDKPIPLAGLAFQS